MVTTRIMWGGWRDVNPDKVRVMWGSWVAPRLIKVRSAGWKDTGYHTSPGPPTSFYVSAWDFDSVTLKWSNPTDVDGITAHSYFEVAQNNSNDTVRVSTQTTETRTATFTVSPDTRHKFYVRSISAKGLGSAWAGPIQAGIGHAAQTAQRWAQRSRAWQSANNMYGMYNGLITGQTAPALNTTSYGFAIGVYITDMYLEVWSPYFGETYGFLRVVCWLGNGVADIDGVWQGFDTPLTWGPSWAATPFRPRWSNGGCWGVWCTGEGYDHKYGAYLPIYENVMLAGTEYYPVIENYTSVARVNNYYW